MALGTIKTEHTGAKNGGGHWGHREDAKMIARKKRRQRDKTETRQEWRKRRGNMAIPNSADLRRWQKQGDPEPEDEEDR